MPGKRKYKDKQLSLKTTIALVVIVFMVCIGSTMIFYTFYRIVLVQPFDIKFEVSEQHKIGINADPTLDFGMIPNRGSSSVKHMNLYNDYDFPVLVEINVEGEAAPFMVFEDNYFTLEPDEYRDISVRVNVAEGTTLGNRTGRAVVIYKRT